MHAGWLCLSLYSLHDCHYHGYQHHCHLWGTQLTAFLCGMKPCDLKLLNRTKAGGPCWHTGGVSRDVGEEEMTAAGDGGRAAELLLSESGWHPVALLLFTSDTVILFWKKKKIITHGNRLIHDMVLRGYCLSAFIPKCQYIVVSKSKTHFCLSVITVLVSLTKA